MAYMKSLTVSGQTYQVKDPDAVSFAEDQSLTAEQQTRARKNLDVWSAVEAMDRLCPSFTESGAVVRCEPVEGYPLEVTAEEGATQTTRCGKNIFGGSALVDELKRMDKGGVTVNEVEKTVTFDPGGMTNSSIFSKFKENTQYTIILYGHNTLGVAATNMIVKYTDGTTGYPRFKEVTENHYVVFKTEKAKTVSFVKILWENGKTVLCYDQCGVFEGDVSVEEFEAYTGKSFELGEHVPALAGINTLWANTGDITVKGKADPVAIINKLTNAILSLGGNV